MSEYLNSLRSRTSRRRFVGGAGISVAGAASLALVGCGDDDDDDDDATAESTGTEAPAATGTATQAATSGTAAATETAAATGTATAVPSEVKTGGTLKCTEAGPTDIFDPAIIVHAGSMGLGTTVVYSGLLVANEEIGIEGHMADLPEQPDELTYVFTLKPNIKWQNLPPLNGRPFTAEDAIFGLQRFIQPNPEFIYGSHFDLVENWEAVDDQTFRLTVAKPHAPLLTSISSDFAMMVSPEMQEQVGDDGLKLYENMIGTGPWLRGELVQGVSNFVTKNPDYFIEGQPYLNRIEYTIMPDSAARIAALSSKQFHLHSLWGGSGKVDSDNLKQLLGDDWIVTPKPNTSWLPVNMNLQIEPFTDLRVRQAMHLAMNRQAIQVSGGGADALPLSGPVQRCLALYALPIEELEGMPGYRAEKDEDLTEAKALLSAAGYPDGITFPGRTYAGYYLAIPQQASLAEAGINIELTEGQAPEILAERASRDFTFITAATGGGIDPDVFLYVHHHTDGTSNYGNYSNPEVDALAEAQRTALDLEERQEIVRELELLLIEESPVIYSVSSVTFAGQLSTVKDRRVAPPFSQWFSSEIWLDE